LISFPVVVGFCNPFFYLWYLWNLFEVKWLAQMGSTMMMSAKAYTPSLEMTNATREHKAYSTTERNMWNCSCTTWKITSQAMDAIPYCCVCIQKLDVSQWVVYTHNIEDMPLLDGGTLLIFEGRRKILLMVGEIWWWLVIMWATLLLIYPHIKKMILVNLKCLFTMNIVTLVCLGFRFWMHQNIDVLNKTYTNSFKMLVLFLSTLHNIISLQHYIFLLESFLCMPTRGEKT
jgi:hypothetical protein